MKIVGIIGSPREEGNCSLLVNELMKKLEGEKDIYPLQDLNINYCKACAKCQNGDCIQNDDIRKIVDEIIKADLFIFSSPIYYGQISAQAKTLIDRFYQVSQNPNKTLESTKVIQIFTQANPEDVYNDYIESMKTMPFSYMGMEVVGTINAKGTSGLGNINNLKDSLKEIEKIVDNL